MKIMFVLLVAAIGFIPGCAQLHEGDLYSSAVMPNVQSVRAAGGEQRYNDTLFWESDFSAEGVVRGLSQYDFAAESAPCTVLGEAYHGVMMGEAEQVFSYPLNGVQLQFSCRPFSPNANADRRRLVLLGSTYECKNQYGLSSQISQRARADSIRCNGYRRSPLSPTAIDLLYKEGKRVTSGLGLPKNLG